LARTLNPTHTPSRSVIAGARSTAGDRPEMCYPRPLHTTFAWNAIASPRDRATSTAADRPPTTLALACKPLAAQTKTPASQPRWPKPLKTLLAGRAQWCTVALPRSA
jgi:hypothetical protein